MKRIAGHHLRRRHRQQPDEPDLTLPRTGWHRSSTPDEPHTATLDHEEVALRGHLVRGGVR